MRRFLTITEPCWRLTQLDLVAVSLARLRKYLSQSVRWVAPPVVDTREIVGDRGTGSAGPQERRIVPAPLFSTEGPRREAGRRHRPDAQRVGRRDRPFSRLPALGGRQRALRLPLSHGPG